MGKAEEHPAYEEETRHLTTTISHLDAQLEGATSHADLLAYPEAGAVAQLHQNYLDQRSRLAALRQEPYFARIDFCESGWDEMRAIYLGLSDIPSSNGSEHLAYDWRAPIAQLYYQGGINDVEFMAPNGIVRGDLYLRRHLQIKTSRLEDISDDYVRRLVPTIVKAPGSVDAAKEFQFGDEYLLTILADKHDDKLREIVTSIQSEQNRLITLAPDQSVIVQGVAGSGKTTVALHRLAYLRYTYPDRITPERVMVLGPNHLFLNSIADVLPILGESDIRQTTFEDWALAHVNHSGLTQRTGERARPLLRSSPNEQLEQFLDITWDRQERVQSYRQSKLLGSRTMINCLDMYAILLRDTVRARIRQFTVTYALPHDVRNGPSYEYRNPGQQATLTLSEETQRRLYLATLQDAQGATRPLGVHRTAFISACLGALWRDFSYAPYYSVPSASDKTQERIDRTRRADFYNVMQKRLSDDVASWWPAYDPVACFNAVFTDRAEIERIAHYGQRSDSDLISPNTLDLLVQPKRTRSDYWPLETIPILMYLDTTVNGPVNPTFTHIIIDEAQDMSPLQIAVLLKNTPNGSLTLLGDIAQGIYSYRGINDWSELEGALEGRMHIRETMRNSYRATYEITRLANDVLKRPIFVHRGVQPAIPVTRHGRPVTLQQCPDWESLTKEVHSVTSMMQHDNLRSVAVLCKTIKHCRELKQWLQRLGIDDLPLIAQSNTFARPKAAIMPAYVAKGLEFDGVIVVGADAQTFTETEYDTTLLYLALTRALHELHVYWVGQVTPALAAAAKTGIPGT